MKSSKPMVLGALVIFGMVCGGAGADQTPAQATPQAPVTSQPAGKVVGWRGDGTGCYPDANPPTEWARTSKTLKDLSAQAQKPKGDAPGGQDVTDGVIRDWLILGPVPQPEGAQLETDFIPDEAKLQPDENEKTADLNWKAIKTETSCLDFNTLLGRKRKVAAYAHTYVYSKAAHPVFLMGSFHRGVRCWLNGKLVCSGGKVSGDKGWWCASAVLKLTPGWNRLLVKLVPDDQWYFNPQLFGREPYEYETKNILWMRPMPGSAHVSQIHVDDRTYSLSEPGCGNASPIVVGDKVFATSETYDLTCLNKADGKILWVRTANYFETLTDDDLKANPALQEAAPWAQRIREINKAYSTATPPDAKMAAEKSALEQKIYTLMLKVDPKKYGLLGGQDLGYAGMAPVSDGKSVYVWYAAGVTVCYDLDGNRKWIRLDNDAAMREHGLASSPVLVGGKLIVHMNETLGLDAATGAVAWRLPREFFQASLLGFALGNEPLFLTPNFAVRRAADGKALFERKGDGAISTPVIKDGIVYIGTQTFKLPPSAAEPFKLEAYKPAVRIPTTGFPQYNDFPCTNASPLVHDGLLYSVNNDGVLSVVDINAGQVLYQRLLDVNVANHDNMRAARGLGASPAMAGKYIYVFGNFGTAVVLQPGRTFKQVAKNRLENSLCQGQWTEHQETSISSPFFDGERLYYRAEQTLYCIGKK